MPWGKCVANCWYQSGGKTIVRQQEEFVIPGVVARTYGWKLWSPGRPSRPAQMAAGSSKMLYCMLLSNAEDGRYTAAKLRMSVPVKP